LALDIVHANLETGWRKARSLIEVGSNLIRQNTSGRGELVWHRAAIALLGGARDQLHLKKHLERARRQFPNEATWRLAEAVADEFPSAFDLWRRDIPWVADADLELRFGSSAARYEQGRRDAIRAAVRSFVDLHDVPAIRGEADVRIGHLLLMLHDSKLSASAIEYFREASTTSQDPVVRYLAFFLTGSALESLNRPHDAELAYRQALVIIPNAQSGVEALAAKLFLAGNPDEAYTLVQASLAATPPPPDPWRMYGSGDYVHWPELIHELRGAF
jgi:tetratricopeptide (TPR) repeat protein